MEKLPPFSIRDFRQGRYNQDNISEYLAPTNSVAFSRNVNFDTTVGKAVVRKGTTLVGSTVASNKTPLGLAEFVLQRGSTNDMLAVFSGASTATVYYYDTSWHASGLTNLANTTANKVRFAELGGQMFLANGAVMKSSTDGNTWGTTNCITTDSVLPSLLFRYNASLLASGDFTTGANHSNSRVYFSSVVAPSSSPGAITWNTDGSTGNWIDINPDDGGYVTGFAETSSFCLVFKNNGMYRLDTLNKTTDARNIFNIGAQSQENIVNCQGTVYFFSGTGIWQTDGGFPKLISRAGVQDVVDAISQANWGAVAAGTDGFNVYFSVGTVTLNSGRDDAKTLTNCVLKFSPRDQSWSIHTYANAFTFFSLFTDSTNGRVMRGASSAGDVQSINVGNTDNTVAVNYELLTQDIDFGDRSHLKKISDKIAVFSKNGQGSYLSCLCDEEEKSIPVEFTKRVDYGKDINLEGHFFNFRWYGINSGQQPIFEGIALDDITDTGMI